VRSVRWTVLAQTAGEGLRGDPARFKDEVKVFV
jgi:hypothetical protein